MREFHLKKQATQRVKAGERLLLAEDIQETGAEDLPEGESILLWGFDKQYAGKALIARQQKGLGWLYTVEADGDWSRMFVDERVKLAYNKRAALFGSKETTAFRLINGEGDQIPGVTVDWYAGFLQINWYSQGIYAFREWIFEALQTLPIHILGIYETQRFGQLKVAEAVRHTWGEEAEKPHLIQENGVTYATYLGEDWMTGIFLDQREVRNFVKQQAKALTVLNLFSYTGAFSVAAEMGGAAKTISVDVANRSLDLTEEQFAVNHLERNQEVREIRVMDVFDYIRYAKRHGLKFDMVICDPPSFARTKQYTFSARQDYAQLAEDLFALTEVGGMTILSTNHSGYPQDAFREDLRMAAERSVAQVHLLQQFGLPEDFQTTADATSQYLKVMAYYRSH
ncbi:hypothetical protein CL176_01460 [Suicoccus acidiformans]|uniref:RlmI/RlmK family 23S rRNA methyltransferase n=1 Tax=Suicoccus acidiformans TaxID=2036206 RepID=A0A347WI81_9LACT|nr:class I SAM-dependent rRNA methyltransferase [Suicoccus acidiformans]AXY24788.1 hypothetical protein CL176_01460 [Suicoccus acidiformans]